MRCSNHKSKIKSYKSSAFTLVELLVVITIIGILIALLLPAVQAAREAARRMQCANNFKQAGVALHNYHAAVGSFPPGMMLYLAKSHASCGPKPSGNYVGWGWTAHILPYIEKQALYDQFDFGEWSPSLTQNVSGHSNFEIGGTRISAYLCPSDPQNGELILYGSGCQNGTHPDEDLRITNMFGVSDPIDWTCDTLWPKQYPLIRGIMGERRSARIADVHDGTSNTLLIGEYTGGGPNSHQGQPWILGGLMDTRDGINGPFSIPGGYPPGPSFNQRWCGASSYHPGGCHFLLADGSVQFLSDELASGTPGTVLYALTTREGGEVIKGAF